MSGILVSSGVTSDALVLSNGAVLTVLSGGTALATVVSPGGIATISGGGSAIASLVQSRGLVEVLSGGVTGFTTVSAYGAEAVYGAAIGTTVRYAASQTVFAGGTAIGSLVEGSEIVASGGVASGADVLDGQEIVAAGGVASDTILAYSSGAVSGNGQITVASGGIMNGAIINHDGYADLSAGAVAIATTLDGGDAGVEGGTAIDTTIGSGSVETVSVVYVFSTGAYASGLASATTIAGGTLALEGGSATGGIVFTGSGPGLLDISGTVMPTTAISGFAASDAIDLQSLAFTGAGAGSAALNASTDVLTVTEGGSSFALQLSGTAAGTRFDLASDTVSGTILAIDTGSTTEVSSGITSSGIGLTNGAVLTVLAGGTAVSAAVSAGGLATVSGAVGLASATTIDGGTLDLAGGSATGGILFTGSGPGLLKIAGTLVPSAAIGGFAASDEIDLQSVIFAGSASASLDASTDALTVAEGGSSVALQLAGSYAGIAFDLSPDTGSGTLVTIDNGGTIAVASGVTSSGLVLSNASVLTVLSGGTAVSVTVSAGGVADIAGGGFAIDTQVNSRGLDEVQSGGVTRYTEVSAYGGEAVYGTAFGTTVLYAATQTVFAGGTAVGSLVDGSEIVGASGVTSGVDLVDGDEFVASGGLASATVVAYASGADVADGEIFVASGGLMAGVVAEHDGYAYLSIGALGLGTILSGGDLALGGGTAIDTTICSGGLESVSVTYVFSTGDFYSGVAGATTIDGGTLDLDGGIATGGIVFTGSGPGLLEISGTVMPAAAISGFTDTDAIDLQSLAFAGSGTASLDAATDVLTVTEGGSTLALQLAGSYAGTVFDLSPDTGSGTVIRNAASGAVIGTSDVPCFAAGTRLAAERGEIAVEHLAVGDRLVTVDGDMKPIAWIGSRRVDCRHHPTPAKVWPVLITAHVFGPDTPRRDLLLSPDHAVFAEGVLIPVKHLINGTTIRQIVIPAVTYLHVGLDHHDVVVAEGLPVETYLDTGDRSAFGGADGPTALYPVFASERGDISLVMDALGYAPLRITGPEVEAVRARLGGRRRYAS